MLRAQPTRPSAPTMLPKFQSVSRLQAFGTAEAAINIAVPHTTTIAELIDFIVYLVEQRFEKARVRFGRIS
jgi:hypothetical protein